MAEVQQQLTSSQSSTSQLQEREANLQHNFEGQAAELASVRCSLEEERQARSDVQTELASVSCMLEEQQQARGNALIELQTVSSSLKHLSDACVFARPVLSASASVTVQRKSR